MSAALAALGLLAIALATIVIIAIYAARVSRLRLETERREWRREKITLVDERKKVELGREFERTTWQEEERRIVAEARVREQALLDKVVEYAGRAPIIVDTSEIVKSIGESISRITQGPPEVALESTRLKQEVAENWAKAMGEAPGAGIDFTPFAEQDDWMNPDRARRQDVPHDDLRPVADAMFRQVSGNGRRPVRTDGKEVEFQSGEGGMPPSGGMEW